MKTLIIQKSNSKPFKMTNNSNRFSLLIFLYQAVFITTDYFQIKSTYRIKVRKNENKVHKAHKPCVQHIVLINISFFFYYYFEKTQTSFTKHANFS